MKKVFVNLEEIIAGTALCIMIVLTSMNVFFRLVASKSFTWADEISYLCYAYVIFVGSSSLYKRFGHSAIDILVRAMPEKFQRAVSSLTMVALLAANLTCFVLSCGFCMSSMTRKTQLLKIPYAVEAFALVLGFGFMTIHSIMFLKNVIKKHDYYHTIPIYDGIFTVDALQDQIDAAKEHERKREEVQ